MDPSSHWLPPAPARVIEGSASQASPTMAVLGPEDPIDQGAPFKSPKRSWRNRLAAPFAALIAALAKLKALLLVLGNFKLITTAGTMAVSVAAYSVLWGWTFALGFVVLLLVHEMGHVIQLRREGIKASTPMFIPFLGAVITAKSLGDNAAAEARVGLAGPILGGIGSALCVVIWQLTGNTFWEALAFVGFLLNLFNLLPVSPLDGGRAMAAMAPAMWFVGLAMMVAYLFLTSFHNPIILLFILVGGMDSWRRWQQLRAGGAEQQAYYRVSPRTRLMVAVVYLALIGLFAVGMTSTNLNATL
ncbi:MAG TPA: site-2 protease family protein [Solirubrobacteraceae bacterium]|nr:site-2 protease family protein [Solirubrobacteraceae bacterium]